MKTITDKEIRKLRLRLGLTQAQLAYRLNVSPSTVQFWERGKFKPSPLALEKLTALQSDKLSNNGL